MPRKRRLRLLSGIFYLLLVRIHLLFRLGGLHLRLLVGRCRPSVVDLRFWQWEKDPLSQMG